MFRASFVKETDDKSEDRRKHVINEEEDANDEHGNHPPQPQGTGNSISPTTSNVLPRLGGNLRDMNLKLDRWMKRYELWLDEHPLRSRCMWWVL
jgi:hypothetical protein